MEVIGNAGDFLERSRNQEDIERGTGWGKGKRERFIAEVSLRTSYAGMCLFPGQVGFIDEGQVTCMKAEEWRVRPHHLGAENHPKLFRVLQWCASQLVAAEGGKELPKTYDFVTHIINSSSKKK